MQSFHIGKVNIMITDNDIGLRIANFHKLLKLHYLYQSQSKIEMVFQGKFLFIPIK